MKKHSKLLRSVIAVLLAILMVGATVPAMTLAADDAAVTQDTASTVTNTFSFFKYILDTIKDFITKVENFFISLFTPKSEPVIPEEIVPDEDWFTPEAPDAGYVITTAEEFAAFADAVNNGNSFKGETVSLGADIDLTGKIWYPVGYDNYFEGTFDGKDYTISNLYVRVDDPESSGVGLFSAAKNAKFKDINVKNVDIAGYKMVAAIVAYPYVGCTISDCHVSGDISIVADYAYAGGIAAYGYVDIDNCSVIADGTGAITAVERNAVGGILAWGLEGKNDITNCHVKNMDLTGWANVGAINGFVHYSNTIDGCSAENINLTKTRDGGHPTIGLAAGGFSYNAKNAITIKNNSFKNITLTSTSNTVSSANVMYGAEYGGALTTNFVMENNSVENINVGFLYN